MQLPPSIAHPFGAGSLVWHVLITNQTSFYAIIMLRWTHRTTIESSPPSNVWTDTVYTSTHACIQKPGLVQVRKRSCSGRAARRCASRVPVVGCTAVSIAMNT